VPSLFLNFVFCRRTKEKAHHCQSIVMATSSTTPKPTLTKCSKKRKRTEWRVYPPKKKQYTYQDGDIVLVKSKDGKTVLNGKIKIDTSEDAKGFFVTLDEEKCLILNDKEQRRRLLPQFSSDPTIIVTPETNHFRQMASQVTSSDKLLEIGCSTGETSKLLIPLCDTWVGLDTSEQMIAQCKTTIGDSLDEKTCHFAIVDALIDPAKAEQECKKFGDLSVIFIDIGGNRECINVLRMVSWVQETFQTPRLIIVKSRELFHSIKSSASIDEGTGLIENGSDWFRQRKQQRALPKHPLKAPMVMSPKDGTTPICRYHNYHKSGCSKQSVCPLDHDHCHACQKPGHIAKDCPKLSAGRLREEPPP
jgi:hypothetical protein